MKKLLLFFTAFFALYWVQAQEYCGFDVVHQRMMQSDSNYARSVQRFATQWAQSQSNSNQNIINNGYGEEYEIPVVVHVIHTGGSVGSAYNPSDATINAAITYLNETYEATYASYPDTNNGGVRFPVKFVLAKRTETCGTTGGIIRVNGSSLTGYSSNGMNLNNSSGAAETAVKALSKWNSGDYYNIWIVNKIDGHDGTTSGSFTAGFAYFPGASASVDGTVVLASRFAAGYTTLPHEIGHAFNLYHTFEGDNGGASCPPTSSCSTTGDEVCDTDPHKRNSSVCPANTATNACTGTTWAANQTQRNIMDYSSCRDRFTAGQRTRWLAALDGQRSGLKSSMGGVAPPSTTTASASCTTTINATNFATAQTANMGPTKIVLNDMTSSSRGFGGDGDTAYVDRTCEQWATVTQGKTYTLSVNTETNRQDVQVYLDLNGNGVFATSEKIFDHNTALSSNGDETHSTSYTIPTSGINTCGPLRMRVVSDWYASSHISNGCGQLDYGQAEDVTVYVKKEADTVTMINAITSGTNPTCSSGSVTFTASTTKTLTSPSYQWYRNSIPVSGATSSTYTATGLSNGTYYVQCKINYTNLCSAADSGFTNAIALVVSGTTVTPSVSIAANPGNTICSGTSVTFTPTPTNGGTSPTYQWKVNGSNVATGGTYTTTSLANSDAVTCVMTSNAACASPTTATSNTITMSVTSSVTPSVSIAANPGTTICSGTSVMFTATPTNGGTSPTYQWKLNGANVGSGGTTYTNTTLSNNDVVTCEMTSNATCASPTTATSNSLTMTVTTSVTASVAISNLSSTFCRTQNALLKATPTNGGSTPTYQWKRNGANVGTNADTFTVINITTTDVITCEMTTSNSCATPTTTVSNSIQMGSFPASISSVGTIPSSGGGSPTNPICPNDTVQFVAAHTNGGTPTYQWKLNGNIVGTSGNIYTGYSWSNNDTVTCIMTSSLLCANPYIDSVKIPVYVSGTTVTPSVSIASNQGTTICSGSSVTFTATPTNGGTSPTYQWKLNGGNVGTNNPMFNITSLANGDVVTCEMTSNAACASPTTATSNSLTMTVTTSVIPLVTISANPGDTICAGASVTFTATPTNGGTSPTYQWKLNGANVGTGGSSYTNAGLSNGDVVSCVMTSNATCAVPASVSSNSITMTVSSNLTPTVSIAANPGSTGCIGSPVTFTATPTVGGTNPTYQWKLNGSNVGTGGDTYASSTLSTGDTVSCVMTSNATCVTTTTATSNKIIMTMINSVTPSVSITVSPNDTICNGTSVTFTALPTNGGVTPAYQWKLNGANVGTGAATYTTSTLSNGDVVTCEMSSSLLCVTAATVTSNSITMTVNPTITPSVTVTANPGDTVCAGQLAGFYATPTNGGVPHYKWRINGVDVSGQTSTSFNTSTLSNGDVVSVWMLSNAACVSPDTAISAGVTMTVLPNLTPSVSISVNPNDTICAGTSTMFTATPVNGGATPTYQWVINGTTVSTAGNTYTTTGLSDNDTVSCVMTSSEQCVTSSTATSNKIIMTVNPLLTPAVSISVAPDDTVCAGTSVTFTATPTNGGTTPTYQWKLNGANVGTGGTTYMTSTLSNNDVVSCVMTSSETCVTSSTATSNNITMTVNPLLTPLVTIAVSPNDTICDGTMVTFTATPTNGGTAPSYQWRKNGTNITGATSATYSTNTLVNSDVISVVMTSNAPCLTISTVTSNNITMTVNQNLTPDVTISVAPNDTICAGTQADFTATATNGGTMPTFQWTLNGTNVGTSSIFYSNNGLSSGDVVRCVLTSSEACVTKTTDTSSSIIMHVNPLTMPSVAISSNIGTTTCEGGTVVFTATPTNGGTSQAYQWKLNGNNITGATNISYSTNTLNNGDVITCDLTITALCPSPATVTSNALTMSVLVPTINISVSPSDTICAGTSAMFTANVTNVGPNPQYQWYKSGVQMIGVTANVFTIPLPIDGDEVTTVFTGSDICVNAPRNSDTITLSVSPIVNPVATIYVTPDSNISPGQYVIFNAVTNVNNASFQWVKNGTNIAGATNNTLVTGAIADQDTFYCRVSTTDSCASVSSVMSNRIRMSVAPVSVNTVQRELFDVITLAPNPNNGNFNIKGKLWDSRVNDDINIEVINTLGAVVYKGKIEVQRGEFNHHVDLGDIADGGLHMVRLHLNGSVHYMKFITAR